MKKYNTPELKIAMFDTESVATALSNTNNMWNDQVNDGTMAVNSYNWSELNIEWTY